MRRSFLVFLSIVLLGGATYAGGVFGCGGSSDSGGGGGVVSVNDLDGASDVAADSVFKYVFSQAIDTSTVTQETFFMVAAGAADADISKASFEPAKCDNTQMIDAIVSCLTTTECTLDPTANLGSYRRYYVCLSDSIRYSNGNPFEGFMATFTTAGTVATYTVGGTVTGLGEGEQVVLYNNGADDLTVTADGAFTFVTGLADGAAFEVSVKTQPTGQTCSIANGTGVIAGDDVNNIEVECLGPWARSTTEGNDVSAFRAIAAAPDGSIYAVGDMKGTGTYGFGNGVTASGKYATSNNALVVKYNTYGTAQWASTPIAASWTSLFLSAATDSSGNVYAVGYMVKAGDFDFGSGVINGVYDSGNNAVIVKYDSQGNTVWSKTVLTGDSASEFYGVTVDDDDNVYAVGTILGQSSYSFGNGQATSGTNTGGNAVIVKYNTSGDAQWARSTDQGSDESNFYSVFADSSGTISAVGRIRNTVTYGFGGASTSGAYSGLNCVIVKYNAAGTAQWAKSVSSASDNSVFEGVAADANGNVYAAGTINNTGSFNLGNGVTASAPYSGENAVIVKYNSSGDAQWARTVTTANDKSIYYAVSADPSGNVYAAGYITGTGSFNFGNNNILNGVSSTENIALIQYNSSGLAVDGKTVMPSSSSGSSRLFAATSTEEGLYVGGMMGSGEYTFDTNVSASGTSSFNVLIIKFVNE